MTAIVIRAAWARWRTRVTRTQCKKTALRQRPTTLSRQAWSHPIGNVVIGSGLALIAQLRFATSFRRSAIAAFVQFLRRLVVPFRASAYWTDRDRIAPHAQTPEGSATCLFATLYPFPRRLGGTADYGNEWRLENTCLALPRCIALAIRLTPRPSPQPGASTPRYLRRAGALNPIADARSENAPRQDKESPRKLFVYISDDGDILGIRYDNFKFVFLEQRCKGTMEVWGEPFTRLRIPKLYNLRADPYEFADVTSNSYWDWYIYHGYMILAAQRIAGAFADTFKELPAIQRANSFTIDDALRAMSEAASGGKQ